MNGFILVIYTVVAMAGNPSGVYVRHDWRPIGEFGTAADCDNARGLMGSDAKERSRCLPKGSK